MDWTRGISSQASAAGRCAKERIYLDKNHSNTLHDKITAIDRALTRPWTTDRVVVRVPVPYWTENSCHEANLHVRIGKEEYFVCADDKLMPVRADQPPPDLSHFCSAAEVIRPDIAASAEQPSGTMSFPTTPADGRLTL